MNDPTHTKIGLPTTRRVNATTAMTSSNDTWTIVDDAFRPEHARAYEGLFTLGSGYLHVRGSLPEHLANAPQNVTYERRAANVTSERFPETLVKWGTYVPGIWGAHPTLGRELVNLPHPLLLVPTVDGEQLDVTQAAIQTHRRMLRMDVASLERTLSWNTRSGKNVRLTDEMFVHGSRMHLILQQMTLTCSESASFSIRAGIDADVRTNGFDHFRSVDVDATADGVTCRVVTDQDDIVEMHSQVRGPGVRRIERESRRGWCILDSQLAPGVPMTIEKRTAICTSRDPEHVDSRKCLETVESLDFESLRAEHADHWRNRWATCDIEIEGDQAAQRAVRAALYHMLRVHVPGDARVAIDPKGYAGDAYWGRYFWDTEMFLLPFYLYTDSTRARTLTDYRVQSLPGARRNAARYGYSGARFAWEADDRGDEYCPNWQYADHEVHVTADVVFGMGHYARATGDGDYLNGPAAEVLVETGRYWLERIDRRAGDAYPSLLGVMGPDEFTPISSNNAYTNMLVSEALKLAAKHGIAGGASTDECESFLSAAHGLPIPRSSDGRLVLQCEEFPLLAEPYFEIHWRDRSKTFASQVSQERLYRSKCLKQADVLMLMALLPGRFSRTEIEQAWDYYLPYTTHDSSLSAGVHAIVAARLGKPDDAWRFWEKASAIDLDVGHGGAAEGVHIANAGAVWQMIVFGFAGMQTAMETDVLTLDPHVPTLWKRLSFPISWHGTRYEIVMTQREVRATNRGDAPQPVRVNGDQRTIAPGARASWTIG